MKKIILAILVLFFVGCSNKVSEVFQKDDKYITLTQCTQRGQIIKSFETIALINATYLNPILKNNETQKNEVFIIGVYNENDYKGYKKGGVFNNHYQLTMNGLKFTKAIKADNKTLNLKSYPFYNKWMKYYKVYFPKTDLGIDKLKITYTNLDKNVSVTLSIPKELYLE